MESGAARPFPVLFRYVVACAETAGMAVPGVMLPLIGQFRMRSYTCRT